MERRWNVTGRRKPKYSEITCPIDTLYSTSQMYWPAVEHGPVDKRLATNRLRHGTNHFFVYFNSVLVFKWGARWRSG